MTIRGEVAVTVEIGCHSSSGSVIGPVVDDQASIFRIDRAELRVKGHAQHPAIVPALRAGAIVKHMDLTPLLSN
jgi:hypothetical protein